MNCLSRAADGGENAPRALLENDSGDSFPLENEVTETVARQQDHPLFRILLANWGDEVRITSGVVEAAAGNYRWGKEVMALLLDRRGDEVHITSDIIKLLHGQSYSPWRQM
jgi:hypothetical protein